MQFPSDGRPAVASGVPDLQDVAIRAIEIGLALGADQAVARTRASAAVRITARDGQIDSAVRDAGQGLTLTLYRGARAGTVTTAAFDAAAIRDAAAEALVIAGLVGEDADALPASLAEMATEGPLPPLHAPSDIGPAELRAMALEGDALLRAVSSGDVRIETVAAGASSMTGASVLATSAGFCRGQDYTVYSAWLAALARDGASAVNDSADSSDRRLARVEPMAILADRAIARARGRLGARAVSSQRVPVLFEARAAIALLNDLVAALSGNRQARKSTFLPDALGRTATAAHIDLVEDPFEPFGMASGGFDGDGIAGRRRAILDAGVVQGLFLGLRSARRLGLPSSGNADGPWNLRLTSRADRGDFAALCRRMGRGLIVRRMTGGATDPVSGAWSYAVSGTWVEDGVPVHAVTDVTVGGNLRDMLTGIVAVGDDVHRAGPLRTGSLLIDDLQIGGAA